MHFIVTWGIIKKRRNKRNKNIHYKKDEVVKRGAYKTGYGCDTDVKEQIGTNKNIRTYGNIILAWQSLCG